MNPILLLTGLLALAYFGSMLVERRSMSGFGLPSGTEYVIIGVLIGPKFMALISREGLASFEVLTAVGLAWTALIAGARYGFAHGRRLPPARLALGLGLTLLAAALTGSAAALVALWTTELDRPQLIVLGLGVGAVSAETTRHAVGWVVERYSARGPLSQRIDDMAHADEAVPLLLIAVVAAFTVDHASLALPWPAWVGGPVTLGIGLAMGATCAALFDIEPRTYQRWGIIVGTSLLAVGVSLRLGRSGLATAFVMGVAAAGLSRKRATLESLLGTTERAVMLPSLVLAGAYVTLPRAVPLLPVAVAAIAARFAAKWIAARVQLGAAASLRSTLTLGAGLMPAGLLSLTVGFACALRSPGPVGETILAVAAIHALLGEMLGPAALRRALRDAGELEEPVSAASRGQSPLPPAAAGPGRVAGSDAVSREPTRPAPGEPT